MHRHRNSVEDYSPQCKLPPHSKLNLDGLDDNPRRVLKESRSIDRKEEADIKLPPIKGADDSPAKVLSLYSLLLHSPQFPAFNGSL